MRWLLLGAAVSCIAVSVFVLVFAAPSGSFLWLNGWTIGMNLVMAAWLLLERPDSRRSA